MFVCLWNNQTKPYSIRPNPTHSNQANIAKFLNQTKPSQQSIQKFYFLLYQWCLNQKYLTSMLVLRNSCTDLYLSSFVQILVRCSVGISRQTFLFSCGYKWITYRPLFYRSMEASTSSARRIASYILPSFLLSVGLNIPKGAKINIEIQSVQSI